MERESEEGTEEGVCECESEISHNSSGQPILTFGATVTNYRIPQEVLSSQIITRSQSPDSDCPSPARDSFLGDAYCPCSRHGHVLRFSLLFRTGSRRSVDEPCAGWKKKGRAICFLYLRYAGNCVLFFVESDLWGVFAGMVMCPLSASLSILSLSPCM